MAGPPPPFLDANIILRHVLSDDPNHSPRAQAYFRRIARREISVRTTDTVIFEAVFTLERTYKVSRHDIQEALTAILALPGVVLPGKRRYRRVFDLYVTFPGLSFADCFYISLMERLGLREIVSFDQGFDRVPGIIRQEP
jgi:predicted nucleic acid-binding protein